jgi:hypothetical protein
VKPLCIDLYCGLGGWAEGFLSEGYRVIGFDLERHDYGTGGYPGELVLRDVLTLRGSEFVDAAVIVASPPCQRYSYMAMPWRKAKALAAWYRESLERIAELNELFDACFRIQREACAAAGREIPLIVENVRGAQRWVGYAKWHFGSYFLWGDVPALMPIARSVDRKFNPDGTARPPASWFNIADSVNRGQKTVGQSWSRFKETGQVTPHWRLEGLKQAKRMYLRDGHDHTRHLTNPAEHLAIDEAGIKLTSPGHFQKPGSGLDWFDRGAALFGSDSIKRKAASAMLAKIPFPLAQHIARCFKPDSHEQTELSGSGPIPSAQCTETRFVEDKIF